MKQKSLNSSALSSGTHSMIARYSGDLGDLPSESNVVLQIVRAVANLGVTKTCSSTAVVPGEID